MSEAFTWNVPNIFTLAQRLQAMFDQHSAMMMIVEPDTGKIVEVNPASCDFYGYSREEMLELCIQDINMLPDEEIEKYRQLSSAEKQQFSIFPHRKKSGELRLVDSYSCPIFDGEKTLFYNIIFDVTDRELYRQELLREKERIEYLSYHDTLTGLYNRRYIEEIIHRLDQPENLPLSVIMGDVDGLKITNDIFGRQAGDLLLKHVAEDLTRNGRPDDLIARWGGDEFIIFMPRTSIQAAEEIIHKMKTHHVQVKGNTLQMTLSLGYAVKETPERDLQDFLREAEENMYHQKLLEGKSYRNAIVNTLLAALYEKSLETEEHAERMNRYCSSLGLKLQLSSREMGELSLLAILHDIGKVGIDPNILQKPDKLTEKEWAEMKRHPEIGCRIAQSTPELAVIADYIFSHHERWDGWGYPRGLKGEEIPQICRIMAVADAYDAMTNDRVYRKALSHEEALGELKDNAGAQFDPHIVQLFIEIFCAGS
ncbi:MAG: diguanylate cyclase [Clostridia bacterium]|jgi:diguanylate cyclase (GGDEF)-like protein/PAS domain S-box-containing protein|nr:diguanylate cyclase [Clostridia bacterium]